MSPHARMSVYIYSWLGGFVIDSLCAVEQKKAKKGKELEEKNPVEPKMIYDFEVTRLLRRDGRSGWWPAGMGAGVGWIKWHFFFF